MSNKLVPKLQSAWSPIVRTKPLTQEEIEVQNTLQNLYKNTEDLRNGDYDRQQMQIKQEQEQAKKDKRKQAFSNAMLTIAMGENASIATASGYGYDKNGNMGQYYVNDPGVEALRNNLAVLGATGTAVMAPQAVTALAPTVSEGIAPIVATTKAVTNSVKPVLTTVKKYKKPIKWITGAYPFASLGFNIGKIKLKEAKDNREYEENEPYYQESIDSYLNVYKLNESQQSIIDQMDRTDDQFLQIYDWANAGELDYR